MDILPSTQYQLSLDSLTKAFSPEKSARKMINELKESAVVVQARMGSKRLPGKVLMKVSQQVTMLSFILERLRIHFPECRIIVSTTMQHEDDSIISMLNQQHPDVLVYRGAEMDVLHRYYETCRAFNIKTCIRITSDCPFIDPYLIQKGLYIFHREKVNAKQFLYLSNTILRTFPRGLDFEIFSFDGLEYASKTAISSSDREHVTPFMYSGYSSSLYSKVSLSLLPVEECSEWRLTVDTQDDLRLIQKITQLYQIETNNDPVYMTVYDIKKILDDQPELRQINSHVCQKKI